MARRKKVVEIVQPAEIHATVRVWIERTARGYSYGVQDVGRSVGRVRERAQVEFERLHRWVEALRNGGEADEAVGGSD